MTVANLVEPLQRESEVSGKLRARLSMHQKLFGALAVVVLLLLGGLFGAVPETAQLAAHVMYLPVVLAAYYLGLPWSLLVGAAAGLVLSPYLVNVPTSVGWTVHTLFYLAVGAATGAIVAVAESGRRRLLRAQMDTLRNFAVAVEPHDEDALEHCERVAHNARSIGAALGLRSGQLEDLYWSGLLHDIGKVSVPHEILQKPEGLTFEEFLVMRRHARLGAKLLSSLDSFSGVAEAIGAHHERWDGSGYPGGLSGEAIPLEGRILAVADAFEALSSDRPYRTALTPEEAVEEVRRNSAVQFDPRVVAAFEKLLREGRLRMATPSHEEPARKGAPAG